MCVGTYTRINPQKQTPNKGTKAEHKEHTQRTRRTDTTQAGGGAHERGKEDTRHIPRVTSRGSARITWDFQIIPLCESGEFLKVSTSAFPCRAAPHKEKTQIPFADSQEGGNIPLISCQSWKHLLQSSWPCLAFSFAMCVSLACKADTDGVSARLCGNRL